MQPAEYCMCYDKTVISQKAKSTHMSQSQSEPGITSNRLFARFYERASRSSSEKKIMNPLREETAGQAYGVVLETGAGNGLNFAFYNPEKVERVEAVEPDSAMLRYARERIGTARVPVNLMQAPVEHLPFDDDTFDSVVCTLVFCSVTDPLKGLQEIQRVLKPGGVLLMAEHVRSHNRVVTMFQNIGTPINRRVAGNCHLNRDTEQTVYQAGFKSLTRRDTGGGLLPMVVLKVGKPE
jgi:ubiquinone/menaquinone biosynthesis C-methylase UbiE